MKSITLLALLVATLSFAQQPISFLEETTQQKPIDSSTTDVSIESANGNPLVATYTTLSDFQAGVSSLCIDNTLIFENFEGGPAAITYCGPSIGSFGSVCFDPGELEDGFLVEGSYLDEIVFIPAGSLGGVENPLVGTRYFFNYTIITFDPEVYAVAMDLWLNIEPLTQVRIFGANGGLIEQLVVTTPPFTQNFIGFIADEPIKRVELEGAHDSGELFGKLFFGAVCDNIAGIDDNILSKISVFPNPATDVITLSMPESVELQSIAVFDVLGSLVSNEIVNNQIDVSYFKQGVYFLTLTTSTGTITIKISKR